MCPPVPLLITLGRVLTELAGERGYASLAELAGVLNSVPESARREEYTAEELTDWPRPGFGP
jgi:hypothetical protein